MPSRVLPINDCVILPNAPDANGYVRLHKSGGGRARKVLAHRFIYEMLRGDIPAGLQLDHLCRNRRCVNPDHLEVVTARTNVCRSDSIVGVNARKTHCKRGHEFTQENTHLVALKSGHQGRQCRQCVRIHGRAHDAKRRRKAA